jgi:hypothetical protein
MKTVIMELEGSFVRPEDTTSYVAGDLVANDTQAANVIPIEFKHDDQTKLGRDTSIFRCRMIKTSTTLSPEFKLHLFKTKPVSSFGDNSAFLCDNTEDYLGSMSIQVTQSFSDGSAGIGESDQGGEINFVAQGSAVYGLLESVGSYNPASGEQFTFILETSLK